MEKYSRFRDEATGIAPFQTLKPPVQTYSAIQRLSLYGLSILTVPLAIVSWLSYVCVFWWLGPLGRWWLRTVVLRALRVLYIFLEHDGERKLSVRRAGAAGKSRRPRPGDVIITNFVSPLDPLVYTAYRHTQFVFPAKGGFVAVSLGEAVKRALSLPPHTTSQSDPTASSLSNLAKHARSKGAVVVLFAEGTTSNGRGLLTLASTDFANVAGIDERVWPAAIRYTPGAGISTPVPRSIVGWLYGLATSSLWYMVSVKLAGEPLDPSRVSAETVAASISALGRIRRLGNGLDGAAKRDYVARMK